MTVTARQRWTLAPRGRGTLATLSYEAGAGAGAEVGAGAGAGTSAEAGARAMEAAVGLERMGQVVCARSEVLLVSSVKVKLYCIAQCSMRKAKAKAQRCPCDKPNHLTGAPPVAP